jgi:hypothetical protein
VKKFKVSDERGPQATRRENAGLILQEDVPAYHWGPRVKHTGPFKAGGGILQFGGSASQAQTASAAPLLSPCHSLLSRHARANLAGAAYLSMTTLDHPNMLGRCGPSSGSARL